MVAVSTDRSWRRLQAPTAHVSMPVVGDVWGPHPGAPTMSNLRDIVQSIAVGAALLLGLGLLIAIGSSGLELVALR
jgi:hypothetical protein